MSLADLVALLLLGDDRDLDGRPHDQDIPDVPNRDGDRDLGAFERQMRYCGTADTVFCSNFDFRLTAGTGSRKESFMLVVPLPLRFRPGPRATTIGGLPLVESDHAQQRPRRGARRSRHRIDLCPRCERQRMDR